MRGTYDIILTYNMILWMILCMMACEERGECLLLLLCGKPLIGCH